MPNPAMVHATTITNNGTASHSTSAAVAMPAKRIAWPATTNRRAPSRPTSRSCSQEPSIHDSADTVSASPATNVVLPRASVIASGMYASAPKNANVRTPRASVAAGSPRSARRVPGGTSARKAGTPTSAPASTRGTHTMTASAVNPASTSPAPSATRTASRSRLGAASPSTTSSGRSGRYDSTPATIANGTIPRNTQRQPTAFDTALAMPGPSRPGTTHAVDMTANMRGRSASGYARPMAAYAVAGTAPAPNPCTARASTRTSIDGASPPATRPATNRSSPSR